MRAGGPRQAEVTAIGPRLVPPRGGWLPRPGWFAVLVLIAAAFAVVASRPGPPSVIPPTGEAARAEQAIRILLASGPDRDATPSLPADFVAVTGHTPAVMAAPDGTTRAVHVAGGCSSPWGDDNTRWDFSVGCMAHDLGYDLLRYADAKGQPLGPDLREQLDNRLSADMHAMCDINPRDSPGICHVVAGLYSVGLVVNSWHQRWGPPRNEPIGLWSVGLGVIALLLAARMPVRGRSTRRRTLTVNRTPVHHAQSGYLRVLGGLSVAGLVVAESILALASSGPAPADWVWPLTWLLQLVPVFFLAGGHANVLAWQSETSASGRFCHYLAGRIGWLLRPALALITAWLVVPLSLELFRAPPQTTTGFSRIVLQPLWLLGLYLVVVAAAPAMLWVHRRLPLAAPAVLALCAATIGLTAGGPVAAHVGGIVAALLFQQLSFHYADGRLWRVPRPVLVAAATAALLTLVALTTVGGHSKLLIAEPAASASFVPSLLGVLLIGIAQTCVIALPREQGTSRVATGPPARLVALIRSAPMTTYLFYLLAMLVVAGMVSVTRDTGLPADVLAWLAQPRTLLALALIAVPAALAFLMFERRAHTRSPSAEPSPARVPARDPRPFDAVAAVLGLGFGGLGIISFAAAGVSGALPSAPFDPIASLIHLLLGWYLLHCVHVRITACPWPWLLTTIACVPQLVSASSAPDVMIHGVTAVVGLALAVWCAEPARLIRVPNTTDVGHRRPIGRRR